MSLVGEITGTKKVFFRSFCFWSVQIYWFKRVLKTLRFEEMDSKAWLWRKKSIEKTTSSTVATDKSPKGNEEEVFGVISLFFFFFFSLF